MNHHRETCLWIANVRAKRSAPSRVPGALLALLVGITGLVLPRPLPAQEEPPVLVPPAARQGYYLALGLEGVAGHSEDDKLHRKDELGGAALTLRAGQMVTSWFGFGLALDAGQSRNDRWSQTFGGLLAEGQLVLWQSLALHGGLGVGFVQAVDRKEVIDETRFGGGAYYNLGLSYDFFPSRKEGQSGGLGLRPVASLKVLPGSEFRSVMAWVGLELVYWSGLDKQELVLPVDAAFRRGPE